MKKLQSTAEKLSERGTSIKGCFEKKMENSYAFVGVASVICMTLSLAHSSVEIITKLSACLSLERSNNYKFITVS